MARTDIRAFLLPESYHKIQTDLQHKTGEYNILNDPQRI
jgi:hypothetical protein